MEFLFLKNCIQESKIVDFIPADYIDEKAKIKQINHQVNN